MRRCVYLAFLVLLSITAAAQTGNEWINSGQTYFKVPVAKDGIYRLTQPQLVSAGFPSLLNASLIKIYHRGVEQSIKVQSAGIQFNNASDYVEFYGVKNDGTQDAYLYTSPSAQPHQLYNIYSDTTYYFITYGSGAGKRMSTLAPANPGTGAETFHWNEKLIVNKDQYSGGTDYGDIQSSSFEDGEGWTGAQVLQTQTLGYPITGITQAVQAAGVPKLELLITGRGPMNHVVEVYAGARLLGNANFSSFNSFKFTANLQWADISGSGDVTINIKVIGENSQPDRVSVGYLKLLYPQQLVLSSAAEKNFLLRENTNGTSYVEIQSPAASTVLYDVTSADTPALISTSQTTTLNAVVPSTATTRKLYATNTFITPAVKKINFRQINPSAQNYVIITHPLLRKPYGGFTDPVKAFAEYRALPAGGGFDTLTVNVGQLYDLFNYGEPSPLAIFRFMKFLQGGKLPDYLFIIGKGLDPNYNYYRSPGTFTQFKDLVPSAGFPASDMLYSAGLSGTPHAAGVATGRLSAAGPADVVAYFNKLKEFESKPFDDLRKKNILHLSGGLHNSEPQEFRQYLEDYAVIAKSAYLGAKVKAIAKQSTDIEVVNVASEVNGGLNLITLFGHSAPQSSDFDIGFVTDPLMGYNNKGKYPALLMNGCSAGSFFLNTSIFGENWTNTPDRGAIGVIAHSSFGFAYTLRMYSSLFYQIGFADSTFINKGIADIQKEVAKRYLEDNGTGSSSITQVQQMVLLGDPAVSLFGAKKPDYAIDATSVSIGTKDGSKLSALSDTLVLRFVVNNFGRVKNKNFKISVSRKLNDNSTVTYDSAFSTILYSDTVNFVLPGRIDKGFGNNEFTINVDSHDDIDEISESNNVYGQSFFIPLSGTKNLYPDQFAIVNSLTPHLTFQHTDQLSGEREFILELDTTKDFSSTFKKQFVISSTVLASQQVELIDDDTTAYYWRTKLSQPLPNESTQWEGSSFTYIDNGPTGWAQIEFPQLEENSASGLVKDPELRTIEFQQTTTQLDFKIFGDALTDVPSVKINGAEYMLMNQNNNFVCRDNTINLIAFDKKTTQPYVGLYFTWLELNASYQSRQLLCGREPYVINSFMADELNRGDGGDLIQYIDNIAAGDSVVLFNYGDAGFPTWPVQAKTKLGELGISAAQIEGLAAGEPVVIFARKATAPGSAHIVRTGATPLANQQLEVSKTVTGRASSGHLQTMRIGPAAAWNYFEVQYKTDQPTDEVSFDIAGVKLDGTTELIHHDLVDDLQLSDIDASVYPYLVVTFRTTDDTYVTAAQLKKWMVLYEPVAEGLLLYHGSQENQVVAEGQSWTGDYSFVNISDRNFQDSLVVNYGLINDQTFATDTHSKKIFAPAAGDTTKFSVAFPSKGQVGLNDVSVFVNPMVQAENDYDNNVIVLDNFLNVLADSIAPVLSVTFDDRFITNLEPVSPTPQIRIELMDDNPYLSLSDTTAVRVFLKSPCDDDCDFLPVYFKRADIEWSAETDESPFVVLFHPEFLVDGTYSLRVLAKDASGNSAGAEAYEISFVISHDDAVVLSAPYPNPFNYKTNFDFTVSGQNLPRDARLQIINMRGELVNQFTMEDFSDIHFGLNNFSWDGIGADGELIPNGIYVYRLIVVTDGHTVQQQGKIVIAR